MSGIATAIVGSAVVGAVASSYAADQASEASQRGTESAAAAQLEGTRLQIEEIRRQFDYQMRVLQPQIQQQYNAQRAYSDLLGIGGPELGQNLETGFMPTARPMEEQERARQQEIAIYEDYMNRPGTSEEDRASYQAAIDQVRSRPYDQEMLDAQRTARGAQMGGPGTSGVAGDTYGTGGGPGGRFRDPETGAFVDPNLDPTRLSEDTALSRSVMENRLAAGDISEDEYNQYLRENRIAAGTPEEDLMIQRTGDVRLAEGAAGTGVYGDVFTESPGYAFQVEEMGRALDRRRSAGGANIGGRAIMEAQRRAQGLAAGEYYNWAAGRERDLTRLGAAEATDIARGDAAYAQYEQQRIQDIARQDQGYADYLRRQQIDVGRMDTAATQEDALRAADQQRQDQAYYNYLNQIAQMAGFGGGPASQAVSASQAAGAQVGGAYGQQGSALSSLYANQGASDANIAWARGAGINQAIQGGMQNYITAGYAGANIPGFG